MIDFGEFLKEEAKSIIADRMRGDNQKEVGASELLEVGVEMYLLQSMASNVPVPEQAENVSEMAQVQLTLNGREW